MRTYIKIDKQLRQQMMQMFNINRNNLYENLNGLTKSKLGEEIRAYALNNGGKLIKNEEYVPNCQSVDTEDGFAQLFAGGITVMINIRTSTAEITKGKEVLHRYTNVTMNMWANILRLAQDYAEGAIDN